MAKDMRMRELGVSYSVRTQISLSPDQKTAIDRACQEEHISMSEFIRRSVEHYLAEQSRQRAGMLDALRASAGVWAGRTSSGVEYEDALRQEAEERWRREVGDV